MAVTLNKVITRTTGNTINTNTNYSELNTKAGTLADDIVTHIETQVGAAETYVNTVTASNIGAVNTAIGTLTTQVGSLINPSTTGYNKATDDWRDTMMSKAEFNAVAAERRANRAGSGFDEMGTNSPNVSSYPPVNIGIITLPAVVNTFAIGDSTYQPFAKVAINGTASILKSINTSSIAGAYILLPTAPTVLPSTATLTQQQIDSGVIKHADASNSGLIVNGKFDTDTSGWSTYSSTISAVAGKLSINSSTISGNGEWAYQALTCVIGKTYTVELNYISNTTASSLVRISTTNSPTTSMISQSYGSSLGYKTFTFVATQTSHWLYVGFSTSLVSDIIEFDNIAVFPADAISRSDLVFLESWHEDISEKDFVYPLGNVQYLATTGDAGTTVAGTFAGAVTYSLFSDTWQADSALVGKGYVWSTLSDANKKAFVANPENNCYLDGDKVIQVRYRMRVVMGWGDSWLYPNVQTSSTGLGYNADGYCFVKPKGKQIAITDIATSSGSIFGAFKHSWVDTISMINEDYGIFQATGISDVLFSGAYEGKCFALPIALISR